MTSSTIAIRTAGRRCVSCNQRAAAWICETCAFNSTHYSAGFHVNARSTTSTMVAKRGLYPGPSDGYRDIQTLPALGEAERLAVIRDRMKQQDDDDPAPSRDRLKTLKTEAKVYGECARKVDARTAHRERDVTYIASHWNYVSPSDPYRWCDECLYYRKHHTDCPLIATEGAYVGGYPDDGRQPLRPRFVKLASPGKHWAPMHHKQHRRAIARRWQAFVDMWEKIGLAYFTQMLKTHGRPVDPVKQTKPRSRLSQEVLEKIGCDEVALASAEHVERVQVT